MAALLCVCLPEYCGFSVSLSRDVFQDNHLSETFERRQHRETARLHRVPLCRLRELGLAAPL
jgi:hypothetical protein